MRERPIFLIGGGYGDSGIDIQANSNMFIKKTEENHLHSVDITTMAVMPEIHIPLRKSSAHLANNNSD